MRKSAVIFLISIIATLLPGNPYKAAALGKDIIHRYAIVIGSNNGGPSRIMLKYAVSDAGQLMNVLHNLGGVSEENSILLYDPDVSNFYSAFRKIKRKVMDNKNISRRVEFFFYYSGHSDEEGILLGHEKLTYKNIKKSIEFIPADFRIAILDSCSSGAFTQLKGGKKKPPFLFDESHNMKGNAILTSSSSDEASQESDNIKGSFFTHYLVTGLRGAADVTQDNRITLNEAYHFAYTETLSRTEKTLSGPQHPNYNIQMTGTGDVILTDIRKGASTLILSRNLSGKFFINDSEDILVSEFRKAYGRPMSIGLDKGRYSIVNQRENGIYMASVELSGKNPRYIALKDLNLSQPEKTYSRGDTKEKKDSVLISDPSQMNTLISDFSKLRLSGYGAPVFSFCRVGSTYGTFVGGKGGLIINRRYVIGGGGFGMAAPEKREDISGIPYTGDQALVQMGYGGGMLEYFYSPSTLINASAAVMIGGGGLGVSDRYDNQAPENKTDTFFFVEPEINLSLNVTWFFRFSVGVSYRYVNGLGFYEFRDSDFSGFNARIAFAFGVF